MNDLGPLAERLKKVEDRSDELHAAEPRSRAEGLDGRVLEKVIAALEARLSEHISQVERRIAGMDAKVALDLHAAEREILSQGGAFEKAIQQIQDELRNYSAEQVAGVDQKIIALQESLPAKFREIIEAVRQSMEARTALELKEMEMRVQTRGVSAEGLDDVETRLRAALDGLTGKLAADIERLTGQQQRQAREIVEVVEASINARMGDTNTRAVERIERLEAVVAGLPTAELGALGQRVADLQQSIPAVEAKLTTLRDELPPKIRQIVEAVEASMQTRLAASENAVSARFLEHASQVSSVDQKLTVLQAELPPKFKAIVDAMRQSFETKMAAELKVLEERNRAQIDQAGAATELRKELNGALQYISLLESRIRTLEHNTQSNFEEATDRAAERVLRSLEYRLQERAARTGTTAAPSEMITELREQSTSAEQSVLDLIAGIGHLFDSTSVPVEAPKADPEPEKIEPERSPGAVSDNLVARVGAAGEAPPLDPEVAGEAPAEGQAEGKPSVILFTPKEEPGRKWRIPFVSSFFLMTLVIAWLQFTSG